MTLIKLPAHKAGLFISHNEHRYSGRDVAAGLDYFWSKRGKLSQEDRETLALAKDLRENAPLNGLLGIIDAAHRATEHECTCGGNPADDPQCCPACKVYHRLEAAKAASMSNTKLTHD